ncbi:FAD-dependent monooxygenase [Phytomonospora sp. NPDC050363]|uniref:FAD-dependent monooxygenase n=1 Tax=Phytomonospora sp. NPDC050363 TaxID=3155642 RepID=UPI0033C0F696
MKTQSVLISGGSIAGTALAYWLRRHGFEVAIVELTPQLRKGGQAIDVRGPAVEVAERMGVLESLRARRIVSHGMSMVDGDGTEVYRSTEQTLTGGEIGSPDVEILREDLAQVMAGAAEGVEYIFGDSITEIRQDGDGVTVEFQNHPERRFDLVIGADGLHSNTRRLVYGDEQDHITHLGTYLAVWTVPNFLDLKNWQVFHQMPGDSWGGGVMSVRDNTECRAYLGFEEAEPLVYDYRDLDAQKRILADRLGNGAWILPKLLDHMWQADDFHFDSMAQIHLDHWSVGRVALVGDAAHCGSPLSGQGTSLAMVGAYVLAGELKAAGGDHEIAFGNYQAEIGAWVADNQHMALTNKARVEAQRNGDSEEEPGLSTDDDFRRIVDGYKLKDYA